MAQELKALSELGFNRPLYEDILNMQIARAKTLFGDDIDTSELSALGKYIRINVADLDTLYQDLEDIYYARFPNTASGTNLDRLLPFAGITRNPATYSRYIVRIIGTKYSTVEAGFKVSTEDQSVVFHVLYNYVLDGDVIKENGEIDTEKGYADCLVDCDEAGTIGNVLFTAIKVIVNPSATAESVEGIERVSVGEDRESDLSLRMRFKRAITGTGSGTIEAIKGAIMRIYGVNGCSVAENATGEIVNGIEPYSFKCFVSYDDDNLTEEIAKAIFDKKPIGIKSVGSQSADVEDSGGNIHTIHFERSEPVYVTINITLTKNANFNTVNGVETIKTNILEYFDTFTNGTDVYLSALYSFINIEGVVNVSALSITAESGRIVSGNLICEDHQIAKTTADKINITIEG